MKTASVTNKNKVHSGWWWIPGKKNKKSQGSLHLPTEEIIKLDLHGNLGASGSLNPKIIHGTAISGKDFTLLNNAGAEFISGLNGYYRSFTPAIVLKALTSATYRNSFLPTSWLILRTSKNGAPSRLSSAKDF